MSRSQLEVADSVRAAGAAFLELNCGSATSNDFYVRGEPVGAKFWSFPTKLFASQRLSINDGGTQAPAFIIEGIP